METKTLNLLQMAGIDPDNLPDLAKMTPGPAMGKGSELTEWQKARLGKVTASNFDKVKRLKNGEWGETALSYLYDILGEHLTGKPAETFTGSRATDWGNEYEKEAIDAYTKRTGKKVKPGHFCQDRELKLVGGTPDGFVGEKGLLEAKCPITFKNHLRTVIERKVPEEYMAQVLGHLMLSGRDWCDFVSYDPRIGNRHRLVIVRVRANEYRAELKELAERIIDFHGLLVEKMGLLGIKMA